jgi:succinate dehydrogenase / fumarate reductase cytochrome b subunit
MKKRPVNLDLRTIKMPVTAIISILHRISGLLLLFFIPVFLWGLQHSLSSAQGLMDIQALFDSNILLFIVWVFLSALIYHLIAGIRHLLMDIGIGETLIGGRRGAWLVAGVAVIAIVILGVWLW